MHDIALHDGKVRCTHLAKLFWSVHCSHCVQLLACLETVITIVPLSVVMAERGLNPFVKAFIYFARSLKPSFIRNPPAKLVGTDHLGNKYYEAAPSMLQCIVMAECFAQLELSCY